MKEKKSKDNDDQKQQTNKHRKKVPQLHDSFGLINHLCFAKPEAATQARRVKAS